MWQPLLDATQVGRAAPGEPHVAAKAAHVTTRYDPAKLRDQRLRVIRALRGARNTVWIASHVGIRHLHLAHESLASARADAEEMAARYLVRIEVWVAQDALDMRREEQRKAQSATRVGERTLKEA